MTAILAIHRALSNTLWMFYLALALWGILRAIRGRPVDGSYFGAIVVIQIVVVLQGLLGGIIYLGSDLRPDRELVHYLYAAFSVVFLPGLFAYMKGDDSNRAMWVYALASLFQFGVVLRIIGTAV